jgi:serine phosphatase RsbU (regulator of sigma subunit)
VFVVGLLVTIALAWISQTQYSNTENRLLSLRLKDAGAILTEALPSIQTPLGSAVALADATGGDMAKFKRFVAPYVGLAPGRTFMGVSLWRFGNPGAGPVAVVGAPPGLTPGSPHTAAFFAHAATATGLTVIGPLGSTLPRLGYGFSGAGRSGRFIAYGESPLPRNRYSAVQRDSSFTDLNYALFLGAAQPANLLITSVKKLPLSGHTDRERIRFGDRYLTFVMSKRKSLSGTFSQRLPWGIAVLGLLLTVGATLLTVGLIRRRLEAEGLARRLEQVAEENRRLYAEQRGIAQTLQHALLPDILPQPPGLQTAARYQAGVQGVEVGGDWYDIIIVDDRRLLLVVGDVSGRGLRAATTMAALRYAIRAYAAEGDDPPAMCAKLSRLISVRASGQLATVLCVLVDVAERTLGVTTAGHLPPLLIGEDGARFIDSEVGLPVGVDEDATYSQKIVSVPSGATLLAFTDGLVERRGENIDIGLERLREQASTNHVSLPELLNQVLSELRDDSSEDDTAIAGIRWVS